MATPQEEDTCTEWCAAPYFTEGSTAARNFDESEGDGRSTGAEPIGDPFEVRDPDDGDHVVFEEIEDPDDPIPDDPSDEASPDPDSDAHLFRIDIDGQLYTRSGINYDFKTKTTYKIRLVICDNAFNRDRIVVTIHLKDVDEPPQKPDAPAVEGVSSTSLSVNWNPPRNNEGRPPVTDYDLRYREAGGTDDDWRPWHHSGTQTNAIISPASPSLTPNTQYAVQVLARNHEGASDWSDSGTGLTKEAGQDNPPVFREGSSTTRSLSENIGNITRSVRNIGDPVAATNDDGNSQLTYSLEGTDAAAFETTTGPVSSRPCLTGFTALRPSLPTP